MKKIILLVGILILLAPTVFAEIINPSSTRVCNFGSCSITSYADARWQQDESGSYKNYTDVSKLTKEGSGADWYLSLKWNGKEIKLNPYLVINGQKHDKVSPNANFNITTDIQDKKSMWKFGHRLIKNQNIDAFGYDILTNLSCSPAPHNSIVCGEQKISFQDIIETTNANVQVYPNNIKITNLNYASYIYLDPTVTLNSTSWLHADTQTYEANPNTNYGGSDDLVYGYGRRYAFFEIDKSYFINSTDPYIHSLSTLNLTQVNLSLYETVHTGPLIGNITYCNDNFAETTLTWNNMDTEVINCSINILTNWNIWAGAGNRDVFDITNVFNNNSNGIFTIKFWGGLQPGKHVQYASKEYGTINYRPLLIITGPQKLQINIKDETTNNPILQNVTVSLTGTSTFINYVTTSGNLTLFNILDDNYEIYISSSGYNYRIYWINATGETTLDAYLLNTSINTAQQTTFTVTNTINQPIESASINVSKIINGVWKTISNSLTDPMGKIIIYLDTTVKYRFAVQKSEYQNKMFDLYPSTNSYIIILKELGTIFNNTQGDIIYSIIPIGSVLMANDSQSFNLTTSSPSGYIVNYGVYYNFTIFDNNTDVNGGTASINLNTSGMENSTISIIYFIQSQGGLIQINQHYLIYGAEYETNQSVTGIFKNLVSQINPFYRFMIAIFVSLIVGAGFFVLLGVVASSFIALGIFIFFGIVGFIPIWLPIVTGIIIILGYIAIGGNEGV